MISGITLNPMNAYTLATLISEMKPAGVKPVAPVYRSTPDYHRKPHLSYKQLHELMELAGSVPRSPLPEATKELLKVSYLDVWV